MDDPITKFKKSSRLNAKKEEKLQVQIDKNWKPSTIDLLISYEDRLDDPPKIWKNFKIYTDQEGNIIASQFVETLKNDGYVRQQSSLSFFNKNKNIYVYGFLAPKDPRSINNKINYSYISSNQLHLKIRNKKKVILQALIDQQRQKYDENQDQKNNKQKQKKIGEVVEKVALWRKFYTGFYDELGNYIQKPLQNAAQEVGIAKKTLDDYLLQIRNGKKYGFNFNEKVNSKIGELRAFVREQKKKEGNR